MRVLPKGVAVLLAVLMVQASAAAQRTTATHPVSLAVHGQVRYGDTGTPAANVLVRLESFSGGVTGQMLTDREGKFVFSGLASTQYILTIHAAGYKDFQQSIDLLTATSDFVYAHLARERQSVTKRVGYIDANVPENAQKEFEKGQIALEEQKKKEIAIRHFEKAVQIYPKFLEAELSLGTVYMDMGDWAKAEVALKQAIEIGPKIQTPYLALGELLLRTDRLVEAERTLRQGLKLENRSWQAHFVLARVYVKKNDLQNAGRQLALTLQLNTEVAEAHLLAGDVLMRAGVLEDALTEFQEYLRLDPKGSHSDQVRGIVGRLKTAVKPKS